MYVRQNNRLIVLVCSLASGYVSQHILSRSSSPEIERVAAGRASVVKTLGCMAGLTLTLVCVAAAGLLVFVQ